MKPDGPVGLLVILVEFGMGKGAGELGICAEALFEPPEGVMPVELLAPPV